MQLQEIIGEFFRDVVHWLTEQRQIPVGKLLGSALVKARLQKLTGLFVILSFKSDTWWTCAADKVNEPLIFAHILQ